MPPLTGDFMTYPYTTQIAAAEAIIATGKRLDDKKLITAISGNISCRLAENSILITASGICKANLELNDVLRIDNQGERFSANLMEKIDNRKPSIETFLHLALYNLDASIYAIVHAHPPFATALANSGRSIDHNLLEEAQKLLGEVPLIPHYAAGTSELAFAVARAKGEAFAMLLAGHGAITWGNSLELAIARMEALEHTAEVMLYQHLWEK